MPDLKCHQTNCAHNHDIKCGLPGICVSEHALCDSFDVKDAVVDFTAEFARELSFTFTNRKTEVVCRDRECQNNCEGQCSLHNLRIDDLEGCPRCVNFRSK